MFSSAVKHFRKISEVIMRNNSGAWKIQAIVVAPDNSTWETLNVPVECGS